MPRITIFPDALKENYRLLRARAEGNLLPVLKADAYGHGAALVLHTLKEEGAAACAVASAQEALELYESCKEEFTKPRILILGPMEKDVLHSLAALPISLSVHSIRYARFLSEEMAKAKARLLLPEHATLSVHLKLETGMHRLGLCEESEVRAACALPHLAVTGAYSHLGNAADAEQTEAQRARLAALLPCLPRGCFTHLSASEGLLRHGLLGFDGARVGLALYGVAPEGISLPLSPVMRFSARVLAVFRVKQGMEIGYGSMRAPRNLRLAVLEAGYADGVPPTAACGGAVWIRGERCPFFGAVCMDRCTLDIGSLPLSEGEEVTLFGETAGDTARFAKAAGVSPYLLLSVRSRRTPRTVATQEEHDGNAE